MVIHQGEVYWVSFAEGRGSEPWGRRPALILQHDRFNQSRLNTVVVAAITSKLRYAALPGNVRLRRGEANLPKPCVVNVTQIQTIDCAYLQEKIGSVSHRVLQQVWAGVRLVLEVNGGMRL
ncbi:MAG TPA: type II toxin-antitoxin system PemK/MazF family toxin [Methylomirabilota bacterium]|nr:type II toxin-antitoxin system PemK/MazF family toxin [Methylomirabilota bacterium]